MPEPFSIKCCQSDTKLTLARENSDYCVADFHGRNFSGRLRIYDNHLESLSVFFEDISLNWKGWQGEKNWEALEGDLKLTATSNNLGNVILTVRLVNHDDVAHWETAGEIHIEAGALDSIRLQASKVFN